MPILAAAQNCSRLYSGTRDATLSYWKQGLASRIEDGQAVLGVHRRTVVLVPQSQVQGDGGADMPVVLNETIEGPVLKGLVIVVDAEKT